MNKTPIRVIIEIYKREIWVTLATLKDEVEKRIYLYELLQQYNKVLLNSAVKNGVRLQNLDHFIDEGFKGLYGLDRKGLRELRKLPEDSNIFEFMGVKELFINLVFTVLSVENLDQNL